MTYWGIYKAGFWWSQQRQSPLLWPWPPTYLKDMLGKCQTVHAYLTDARGIPSLHRELEWAIARNKRVVLDLPDDMLLQLPPFLIDKCLSEDILPRQCDLDTIMPSSAHLPTQASTPDKYMAHINGCRSHKGRPSRNVQVPQITA